MSDRGNIWWRALAAVLWLAPAIAISIVVARNPDGRTVTPLYHDAVEAWKNHEPLYRGVAGMNYLPQFVLVFSPYHTVGRIAGDILWRLSAMAGIGAGLWLFCGVIEKVDRIRAFAMVSLMVMPVGLPAFANGQANAHLAAVLLLAAWCLRSQKFGWAAALLWLSAAIKPLGFAAMGLALAAYPQIWWRLAIGLPVFCGLPFAVAPADYAKDQFAAALSNLRECSAVTENRFADFNGLLRMLGMALPPQAALVVRALAGAVFMVGMWFWVRREFEPRRALLWLSAATVFLMLFNPMTEANSYVILAPALGLLAWQEFQHGDRRVGWLCAFAGLTMGLLPEPLQHVFRDRFSLVWHPALTVVVTGALVWQLVRQVRERDEKGCNPVGVEEI